ncbi:hypothetical protein E2C01_084573 [Portunus trituberculatus]|uniref:Uncharacterized protein n=1 Tax=Portunus trituberculatus TaxID=210409 RepID=A0A5B7J4K5_PORTR|nr:hypothetical protein [Portunus trituberculatus]
MTFSGINGAKVIQRCSIMNTVTTTTAPATSPSLPPFITTSTTDLSTLMFIPTIITG